MLPQDLRPGELPSQAKGEGHGAVDLPAGMVASHGVLQSLRGQRALRLLWDLPTGFQAEAASKVGTTFEMLTHRVGEDHDGNTLLFLKKTRY